MLHVFPERVEMLEVFQDQDDNYCAASVSRTSRDAATNVSCTAELFFEDE